MQLLVEHNTERGVAIQCSYYTIKYPNSYDSQKTTKKPPTNLWLCYTLADNMFYAISIGMSFSRQKKSNVFVEILVIRNPLKIISCTVKLT